MTNVIPGAVRDLSAAQRTLAAPSDRYDDEPLDLTGVWKLRSSHSDSDAVGQRRYACCAATQRGKNIPGFDFYALRGFKPTRYSVQVNGPWCITFEFEDDDACRVDFKQDR